MSARDDYPANEVTAADTHMHLIRSDLYISALDEIDHLRAQLKESVAHINIRYEQARGVVSQMQGVIDEYQRRLDQTTSGGIR